MVASDNSLDIKNIRWGEGGGDGGGGAIVLKGNQISSFSAVLFGCTHTLVSSSCRSGRSYHLFFLDHVMFCMAAG